MQRIFCPTCGAMMKRIKKEDDWTKKKIILHKCEGCNHEIEELEEIKGFG